MKEFILTFIALLPIGLLFSILSTLCTLEALLKQIFDILDINIKNSTYKANNKNSNNKN